MGRPRWRRGGRADRRRSAAHHGSAVRAVSSTVPRAPRPQRRIWALTAKTLGVLAVVGMVAAFSLSSTLVKRAESPGVLVAFWRMIAVSVVWNVVLWSTGRRVTLRDV